MSGRFGRSPMFTRRRERRTRHRRRRLDLGVAKLGKTGQAVVLGLPVKEVLVAGACRCTCNDRMYLLQVSGRAGQCRAGTPGRLAGWGGAAGGARAEGGIPIGSPPVPPLVR